MKKFIHVLITCIFISVFYTGCASFEPVIIPGQPDECNDFYTVMQYYSVQSGDSAFVGTVYEKCNQARKEQRKEKSIDCYKLYPDNLEGFSKCLK
jgi:hypothetical protein